MPATLLKARDEAHIPHAPADDATSEMLRALIVHVAAEPEAQQAPADPEAPDVMLDVEVDGVRCLLIRRRPQEVTHAHVVLSPREQEIARMVAAGYPNKTIAAVLDISSWTVGTHLRRVFAKLGVGSRAAMVARLLEDSYLKQPARPNALRINR